MHATIPSLPHGINHLIQSGIKTGELSGELEGLLDRAGGRIVAGGMATLLKAGFGFLICENLDEVRTQKARAFFEENFVIRDPNAEGGVRYYQGKILFRTRKPGDEMNVYIRFCPDPGDLFKSGPLGQRLNPPAIVSTAAVSETEADRLERDPDKVDLVIRFRDVKAILGMAERPDADVVQLLLENLVQITGNFGHMFKFGAIGKNAQIALSGSH